MAFKSLPIIPLIQQHAADAAFYWQCLEDSLYSLSFDRDKVNSFRYLLNAHLDGLRAAEEVGWEEALTNLEMWLTEGEAFVCAVLAFESGDRARLDKLMAAVEQDLAIMMPGVFTAVRFVSYAKIASDLDEWLASESSLYRQIAIEGCAGHRLTLSDEQIRTFITAKEGGIKAAVCRYIGRRQLAQYLGELHTLFGDEDPAVKEEAALAIAWIWPSSPVLFNQLFSVVKHYLGQAKEGGLSDLIVQQKLAFFTRLAGLVLPYGDPRVVSQLDCLPDYLKILFLAHHGDTKKLPYLLTLMEQKKLAALAFWGVTMVTGIDIDDDKFLILDPEPQEERQNDSEDDDIASAVENLSAGQIKPDINAVKRFLATQNYGYQRLLFGREICSDHCRSLLANRDIPLIIQYSALWHLFRLEPETRYVDLRTC